MTGRRTRRSSGFPCCLSLQIALFGQAGKYLARKIESFANDIRVLLKAANSPQCRRLFTYGFNVRALPIVNSQTASVPATSEQWETVLEKALLFRNSVKGRMEGDFLINTKRVMEDTAYMAKEVISQSLVVHCEVKLLTHIFETETIGIPKTYTYIGVSKLKPFSNHSMTYTEPALQPKGHIASRTGHGSSHNNPSRRGMKFFPKPIGFSQNVG